MKNLLLGSFLFLLLLVSAIPVRAGVWPFKSIRRVRLTSKLAMQRHEWTVLRYGRIYTVGCNRRYTGRHWSQKDKAGKWAIHTVKGKRLTGYKYRSVDETADGLIFGIRKENGKEVAEYMDATGKITIAETTPVSRYTDF